MSDTSKTNAPMSSNAKTGWLIMAGVVVLGMIIAWFTLDAGKVWVTSETVAYTQVESSRHIDDWISEDQASLMIEIDGRHDSVHTVAGYEPLAIVEIKTEAVDGEDKTFAHVQGDFTADAWKASDSEPLAEALGAGWTTTGATVSWIVDTEVKPDTTGARLSINRTIGVWLAAILTLFIMSFLAGDNPFYKTAEAIVIGVSAAYWMVLSFWTGIVDKLLVNLIPDTTRAWAVPGLPESAHFNWIYLIPLVLSCMLVWRLSPKGGWIARWPLAFVIGATAGFRLLSHLESDFLLQIKSTITTLYVAGAEGFQFWPSLSAVVILLSVLCCLVYFFFSMEHKGAVGKTARAGIFVLMVTFGAAFGLTVMGRITLLTERFDFLFKDWLHLL